jgi:hypothetical protein
MVYVLAGSLVALQIRRDHLAQPKHVLTVILGSGIGVPLTYLLLQVSDLVPWIGIPIPMIFATLTVLFPFALGVTESAEAFLASILSVIALFGLGMYFSTNALALYGIPLAILISIGLGLPLYFLGFYWAEIVPMDRDT